MADRPATPAPTTNTRAGGRVPAAVVRSGNTFGRCWAAISTARYPAMLAWERQHVHGLRAGGARQQLERVERGALLGHRLRDGGVRERRGHAHDDLAGRHLGQVGAVRVAAEHPHLGHDGGRPRVVARADPRALGLVVLVEEPGRHAGSGLHDDVRAELRQRRHHGRGQRDAALAVEGLCGDADDQGTRSIGPVGRGGIRSRRHVRLPGAVARVRVSIGSSDAASTTCRM